MSELLPGLIFCGLVALIVAWVVFRRLAFVIHLHGGRAKVLKGKPARQLVTDLNRIGGLWGIDRGLVLGVRRGRAIRLRCLGPIKRQRQALQNAMRYQL
jgi:hypothetical protein